MRNLLSFVLAWIAILGVSASAAAQPDAVRPTIHRVTVNNESGVLTITGAGLGPHLIVTVEETSVPLLPGATDSQVEVAPPPALLTTPGTYRLTVMDPVRQIGDAFVVASQPGTIGPIATPAGTPSAASSAAPVRAGTVAVSPAVATVTQHAAGPAPMTIEDSGIPYRTATGFGALFSNPVGALNGLYNTAGGYTALYSNTTGNDNTAIGGGALFSSTTGSSNTASGFNALVFNTSGNANTASGMNALYSNTTGANNVALGFSAGYFAETGSYNLFLGADVTGTASDTNTIRIGLPYNSGTGVGQNKTFIAGIRGTTVTGGEAVIIDASGKLGSGPFPPAGPDTVGSAQVIDNSLTASDLAPNAVGTSELGDNTVTAAKVAFNYAASASEGGAATDVACVGCVAAAEVSFTFASLGANTFAATQTIGAGNLDLVPSTATAGNVTKNGARFLHNFGFQNTFVGTNAGNLAMTGHDNAAAGFDALKANTTGYYNTANGASALSANTTGHLNTASGALALYSNTTGTDNVATGTVALYFNTTGNDNTANGTGALYANTTGDANTASGSTALHSNTTGIQNTASGLGALADNTTGYNNTASGAVALTSNTTGHYNTAFGFGAGGYATTGSYNVFLGGGVYGTDTDTNTIRLGVPYDGTIGQNRTFIAGIYGTQLSGSPQIVYIDANGQLGTASIGGGGGGFLPMVQLQQHERDQDRKLRDQQTVIDELRARLARLEATAPKARSGK